jgi:NAD(P)-dependent dehydrogenase (short-subunit alcohol dehydrogenase family)
MTLPRQRDERQSSNGEGPAALVTGASSGIGYAIARMLAQEGHEVTLVARQPWKLEMATEQLAGEGHSVHPVVANLAHETEIERAVVAHRERFKRLDVLVNNAGIAISGPVAEIEKKPLQLQANVNLAAPILFYRECAGLLEAAASERGSALVVNTSSISGKYGQASLGVYSATKHGLVGLTEAMNRELGSKGVKSTALCPAYIDTPMTAKVDVPTESMMRPEDCAELVRALLRVSEPCIVPELVMVRAEDRF